MRTMLSLSILAFLLVIAPGRCFGLDMVQKASPQRAKELGMEVRSQAYGADTVLIELQFEAKGDLKTFERVELGMADGDQLLLSAALRDTRTSSGRITVSFIAARASLDKLTLTVVTGEALGPVGYGLRVKDFVDLTKLH